METFTHQVGGWPAEMCSVNVASTPDDFGRARGWLAERAAEMLSVDIETNARDPWHLGFACRSVQFADPVESFVLVVADDARCRWEINRMMFDHPKWVAHFAEKDMSFAHKGLTEPGGPSPIRWGAKDPHVSDTQTVLAVYDPRTVTTQSKKDRIPTKVPRLKGLKDTTTRLLTPALQQAEAELYDWFRTHAPTGHRAGKNRQAKWGFANVPTTERVFQIYAALDPLCTARLYWLMRHELLGRGQWARTEAAMIEQWMMDQATVQHGLQVDGPYAKWLHGEFERVIAEAAEPLRQHGINPSGMGPAVGKAFEALGVSSPKMIEGRPSWDKEALAEIASQVTPSTDPRVRELVERLGLVRKAGKFKVTYVEPMLRAVEHGDGAMHASIRAVGTVTTRMSAQKTESAGPLQQLPKKDPRVRAAVRARRGHVLVTADFAQGEPFTMAALSGDLDYLRDLESGDINSRYATLVYGDAYDPRYGKTAGTLHYLMRQNGKAGWLAACYGAQARRLGLTLSMNMPPEFSHVDGAQTLDTWHATYPVFWAYADSLNSQSVIELDSGHRVPLWDRFFVSDDGHLIVGNRPSRLGLNAKTQGTQSDLLRVAMHRLNHWGWGWALRFALHDELLLEVPEWMAEHARLVLEAAMTVRYRGVTLRCEAVIEGRTWMEQPSQVDASTLPELEEA
jgi:DNA polymerase family A